MKRIPNLSSIIMICKLNTITVGECNRFNYEKELWKRRREREWERENERETGRQITGESERGRERAPKVE